MTDLPNLAIRASAGSGKTYRLTLRYLGLLLRGARPDTILAASFTRKAAGEIRDRVLQRLVLAATDDGELARLRDELDFPDLTSDVCEAICADLLANLHRLRITTIDGFLSDLLRTRLFDAGYAAYPRLCESNDSELDRRRLSAVRAAMTAFGLEPMHELIMALSGRKHERGVLRRLGSVAAEDYDAYRSANPRAWEAVVPPSMPDPHDLETAVRDLQEYAASESRRSWRDAVEKHIDSAIRGAWHELPEAGIAYSIASGTPQYRSTPVPAELRASLELLLRAAGHRLAQDVAARTRAARDFLDMYATYYGRELRDSGIMPFSELARSVEESPVREDSGLPESAQRLRHLLLDEFQDTNREQWQVLRELTSSTSADAPEEAQPRPSVFFVGDAKQAIYGWRGGCSAIFDELDKDIPDLQWETADRSYRSSQVILDCVGQVFGRLHELTIRTDYPQTVERWGRMFGPHTAEKPKPGYVELGYVMPTPHATVSEEPDDDSAGVGSLAAGAAERIRRIVIEHPNARIGVLIRNNLAGAPLLHALSSAGVRAGLESAGGIVDDPAIEVVLCALRLADRPADTAAAFRLLHSPLRDRLGLTDMSPSSLARTSYRLRRDLLDMGYARLIAEWCAELAAWASARGAVRLWQLVLLADQFEPQSSLRPAEFVEWCERQSVTLPADTPVRIMTIHQAKGLEFDAVVLPDLHRSIHAVTPRLLVVRAEEFGPIDAVYAYPSKAARLTNPQFAAAYSAHRESEMADALNVLYVAMTRAKHALYMLLPAPQLNADGTPRKTPISHGTILVEALGSSGRTSQGTPVDAVFRLGDPNWQVEDAGVGASPPRPASIIGPIALKSRPRKRLRSDVAPSHTDTPAFRVRYGGAHISAEERGAVMHAWFEAVGFSEDPEPPDQELIERARTLLSRISDEHARALIDDFRRMLRLPVTQAALARPARLTALYRERLFAVSLGGSMVRGRLDRLVLSRSHDGSTMAVVTDFKTDEVGADAVEARASRYAAQMALYRSAVQEMYGLSEGAVLGELLFVSPGVLHRA